MKTRNNHRIDNPTLNQIVRANRRRELRAYAGILLFIVLLFILTFVLTHVEPVRMSGTIVEDSRGPELKRLYEQALK